MKYLVSRKGDYKKNKTGVATDSLFFALDVIREQDGKGYAMELRERRGNRWCLVDWKNKYR